MSPTILEAFQREFIKIAAVAGELGERILDPVLRRIAQVRQPLQGIAQRGRPRAEILADLRAMSARSGRPGHMTQKVQGMSDEKLIDTLGEGSGAIGLGNFVRRQGEPTAPMGRSMLQRLRSIIKSPQYRQIPAGAVPAEQMVTQMLKGAPARTQAILPGQAMRIQRQSAFMQPTPAKVPLAQRATAALQQQGASPGAMARLRQMAGVSG